jgi:hypothetical protein
MFTFPFRSALKLNPFIFLRRPSVFYSTLFMQGGVFMNKSTKSYRFWLMASFTVCICIAPSFATLLEIKGTDAIYLANRSDVTISPLGTTNPTFPLQRHSYVNPDFSAETFPQFVPASGVSSFAFDATGHIDFFNGLGVGWGPDGGEPNGSTLGNVEGISGYRGPQGSLVGLFLNDDNPLGATPPATIDFSSAGIGASFASLSPALGQVFFIGDGKTGTGTGSLQQFYTPVSATKLFIGIADGWGFNGAPGFYEDNDGSYFVNVSATSVPEPSTVYLLGIGLLFLAGGIKTSKKK